MCAALVAERAEAPPVARSAAPEPAVGVHGLNHYYGEGEARNQVLFGNSIEIPGRRIGDSIACPACRKVRVILRSKVKGEVPGAEGAPGTVSDRLPEVQGSGTEAMPSSPGSA